ncbi:MAG TPA: NAD-dependent deacylase [Phnomibacter sp.]|nr:NAD-dependent deacylase [Phnomibacter sp.]
MEKKHIVVLSGAGISAESGLQTFRDSGGLWENVKVEDVATPRAWRKDPEKVLEFYNYRRQQVLKAEPNAAHKALAELEQDHFVTIITQNIDDLHERAGSSRVLHLHGEILSMRSEHDETLRYRCLGDIKLGDTAEDGAQLRPDIVWFEEAVPAIEQAANITRTADIFVVIGTSLQVYPAASLVEFAPANCPMFLIDKAGVDYYGRRRFTHIQKPATEGIPVLLEHLAAIK